ncbi:MAG TPA: hypothetical protein VFB22_00135 [Candidatus Baltobacteraceae bacterium]|nr:hypothetical protein [Candidatus Baltobacteraceae bacterium]
MRLARRRVVAEHRHARAEGRRRGVPFVVRRQGRTVRHAVERAARRRQIVVRRAQIVRRVQRAEEDEHDRGEDERGGRPAARAAQSAERVGEGDQQPGDPQRGVVHPHAPDESAVRQQDDRESRKREPRETRPQRHESERDEGFEQIRQAADRRDRRDERQRVQHRRGEQRPRAVREGIVVEVRRRPGADARHDDERVDGVGEDGEAGRRAGGEGARAVAAAQRAAGEDRPGDRQLDADVFAQAREHDRARGQPPPRAALERQPPAEQQRREEPEVTELAEAHRDQRRVDEHDRAGAVGDRGRKTVRAPDRGEQRRAGDRGGGEDGLQHPHAVRRSQEGPEERQRRRPVEAVVRSVLDAVAHPAERVEHDLHERPGVRPIAPVGGTNGRKDGEHCERRERADPERTGTREPHRGRVRGLAATVPTW